MNYQIFKRVFDLIVSSIVILLLSPLFLIVSMILIFTGEGNIFYYQIRIGYKNKPFYIWKFATMQKNSAKIGTGTITLPNDARVLPFGRFLRFAKINELPQLINIFIGNMSFVGPRPMVKKGWRRYPDNIRDNIYNVKPGLTGIGSVVFRNEAKIVANFGGNPQEVYAHKIFPYKGALEMWYQNNISFFTDIKIIILTAWVILFSNSKLHEKLFSDLPSMSLD